MHSPVYLFLLLKGKKWYIGWIHWTRKTMICQIINHLIRDKVQFQVQQFYKWISYFIHILKRTMSFLLFNLFFSSFYLFFYIICALLKRTRISTYIWEKNPIHHKKSLKYGEKILLLFKKRNVMLLRMFLYHQTVAHCFKIYRFSNKRSF